MVTGASEFSASYAPIGDETAYYHNPTVSHQRWLQTGDSGWTFGAWDCSATVVAFSARRNGFETRMPYQIQRRKP
jgi:hypothetical protein